MLATAAVLCPSFAKRRKPYVAVEVAAAAACLFVYYTYRVVARVFGTERELPAMKLCGENKKWENNFFFCETKFAVTLSLFLS